MNTMEWTFEMRFALALALGFLVGLERKSSRPERTFSYFAGVRTYTLISLYGFGCAWLHHIGVTTALPIGMASITTLVVAGYIGKIRLGRIGSTSEVAAILTFVVGLLTVVADIWVSMTLAIISTIVLSEKGDLESFVDRLERSEYLAVLKFLLVTVIILPVLPNREFTQFQLNPTRIWQVVIMVSSIGFVGYFLTKKFGSRLGLLLSGLLGGIASSTAVTIAMGRLANRSPEKSGEALQASILASSIMYGRSLVMIWLINPAYVPFLWWKMLLLGGIGIAMIGIIAPHKTVTPDPSVATLNNPFEIRPAMLFGTVFVGLSVLTSIAHQMFGSAGLLLLSLITGAVDITPFVLSVVQQNVPVEKIFVASIILATMSNTIVKGIYFAVISRQLRRATALRFGVWALLHIPLVLFF